MSPFALSPFASKGSRSAAEAVGRRLQAFVRRGLGQQGTELLRNWSPTLVFGGRVNRPHFLSQAFNPALHLEGAEPLQVLHTRRPGRHLERVVVRQLGVRVLEVGVKLDAGTPVLQVHADQVLRQHVDLEFFGLRQVTQVGVYLHPHEQRAVREDLAHRRLGNQVRVCALEQPYVQVPRVLGDHAGPGGAAAQEQDVPAGRHALQPVLHGGHEAPGQPRVVLHHQVLLAFEGSAIVPDVEPGAQVAERTPQGTLRRQLGVRLAEPTAFDGGERGQRRRVHQGPGLQPDARGVDRSEPAQLCGTQIATVEPLQERLQASGVAFQVDHVADHPSIGPFQIRQVLGRE